MYSQFTAITAGDLLAYQKFAFEDTRNATVFCALGVYSYFAMSSRRMTEITLSHDTKFVMPYGSALYLVTEPEQISVTLLRPGDRYLLNSSEIFTAITVDDGATIDPRLTRGHWTFVFIDGLSFHAFRNDNVVYRLPAPSSPQTNQYGDYDLRLNEYGDWVIDDTKEDQS